ncbi:hypothetical protein R3X46_25030, partial [Salmonella enterica subsp. enterica serovar Agona]
FPPFYGRMTRASNSGVPVRRAVEKIIVPATEADTTFTDEGSGRELALLSIRIAILISRPFTGE